MKILFLLLVSTFLFGETIITKDFDEEGYYTFKCVNNYVVVDIITNQDKHINNVKVGWHNPYNNDNFESLECRYFKAWRG